MELLAALGISMVIQIALFVPAFVFKTDKLTDFSYGLTFIILTSVFFFTNEFSLNKLILFGMIIFWSLRLTSYLVLRIILIGKDERFDNVRDDFAKFIRFWLLQGLAVWIILIPTLNFLQVEPADTHFMWVGFAIWLIGFTIESVADMQKYQFKKAPSNKHKWIDSGLWRYSRHPNYFGEILCWVGIYLFTTPYSYDFEMMIGLISPVFIGCLLIFGTGIPPLEDYANKKWGHVKAYQEYRNNTSILVPWFRKRY